MKITVFQSDKGDCLLLTGPGGERVLADGGMGPSFRKHVAPSLARLARARQALDLVYVSHIDQDHIAGILQLMDNAVEWRRYAYQQQQGNHRYPKPKVPQPPVVRAVWHNVFKDQVEDNSGLIEAQLVANMQLANLSPDMVDARLAQQAPIYEGLVTSIREGLLLASRLSRAQLNIPVNREFGGKLIFVDGPCTVPLGRMQLTIIGPLKRDLEKLREEWNEWLREHQAAVEAIRAQAREEALTLPMTEGQMVLSSLLALATELGRRNAVTTPNLASLMLLVEAGGKRLLLTGDGHADDILAGLRLNGRLAGNGSGAEHLHVDVLKVQHHGSHNNLHAEFCRTITADHYILCGNGAHHNPSLAALQALIDARLSGDGPAAGRPFKLWFNSSARVTHPNYAAHMREVEKLVRQAARRSRGQLRYRFLARGSKLNLVL